MPRPPPPFPERLVKKTEEGKYRRFIAMLKQFSINAPLIEALEKMPRYSKFMKDLVTKKRAASFESEDKLQHCSAIATRLLVQNKKDPSAFTILCTIGMLHFAKALCDLGASSNLMPMSIRKSWVDFEVPIIFGRPFLTTGCGLVYMERGQMKFWLNNKEVTFNNCRSMKHESDLKLVSVVNHTVEQESEVAIEERLGVEALAAVLPSYLRDVFLGQNNTLPVIIAADLSEGQVEALTSVLKRFKRDIGWTIADILGFHRAFVLIRVNSHRTTNQVLNINED
ncbi:uncharacterized protein [Solanum tuberosum]|uniref:uncharacterized protein n=1 Tax=Solanum tuberosum TaxID=4113 RepID=UPI00073A2717|nr:PREDICTED: uncharacterized protein LOC107059547 [Solanum tuberosum]